MSAVQLFKPEHLWQTADSVSFESLLKTHCLHKDSYTFFFYIVGAKNTSSGSPDSTRFPRAGLAHARSLPLVSLCYFCCRTCCWPTNIANIKKTSTHDLQGHMVEPNPHRKSLSCTGSKSHHLNLSLPVFFSAEIYIDDTLVRKRDSLCVFHMLTRVVGTQFAIVPLYSNAQTHLLLILKWLFFYTQMHGVNSHNLKTAYVKMGFYF